MKRFFVVTGDASGDIHGSHVIRRMQELMPQVEIQAVGGSHIEATGVDIFYSQRHMGVFGLGVISAVPSHYLLGKRIIAHFKQWRPDAVLLIDYGVFNLWLGAQIKAMGIPVFYFIPPQIWASRRGRIKKIRKAVDHVFCIFPFEQPLYESYGVPVTFVGHPLSEQLPPPPDRANFCYENDLDPDLPIIGLFPGSRKMEIQYLLEPMLGAMPLIQKLAGQPYQFVLARSSAVSDRAFERYFAPMRPVTETVRFAMLQGQNHAILSLSDAILAASGTVTLESALYQTPAVISYKGSWLAYQLAIRLIQVDYIGLPNLLADEAIMPELWMYDVTPAKYAEAVLPFLQDTPQRRHTLEVCAGIQHTLGHTATSLNVVQEIARLMGVTLPAEKPIEIISSLS